MGRHRKNVDWEAIDWRYRDSVISGQIGVSAALLCRHRKEHGIPRGNLGPRIKMPERRPWSSVDWSLRNVDIAKLMQCSTEAVRTMRARVHQTVPAEGLAIPNRLSHIPPARGQQEFPMNIIKVFVYLPERCTPAANGKIYPFCVRAETESGDLIYPYCYEETEEKLAERIEKIKTTGCAVRYRAAGFRVDRREQKDFQGKEQ